MSIPLRRSSSFENIKSNMRLRAPQLEALEKFHSTMCKLPKNLEDCGQGELNTSFKNEFPSWHVSEQGLLSFTFNLATGVGKTKLIGALIAYLYNSNDSKNFLIVTPRAEIIRKFIRELQPENSKYIFAYQS